MRPRPPTRAASDSRRRPVLLMSALLAMALATMTGCNKPKGEAPSPDSPNASVAGAEADTATRQTPIRAVATNPDPRLARALISVASTSPSEAEPCERTCGRLGDCLRESEDFHAHEAGGLELECLSLCVHAPEDSPARADFLACEQRDDCGNLRACAEEGWAELAGVSRGPEVQGIIASADPCKDGCRWMYACMFTGAPPDEAYLDPQLEQQMRTCEDSCKVLNASEREIYANLAACLPDHCGYGMGDECWSY